MLDDFGQRIRDIILSEMDLSRELSDEEICDLIGSVVSREARDRPMTIKDRAELERTIFNSLRRATEEVNKQLKRQMILYKEESTEGGNAIENPLVKVQKVKASGILSQVVDDSTVSGNSIDTSARVSGRSLHKGTGGWSESSDDWYAKVLMQQYILTYMSCYTDTNPNHALNYEVEYIIGGRASDKDNLKIVIAEILALRAAANMAYLAGSASKQAQAMALAAIIGGITLTPEVIEGVEKGILAAWAFCESVLDLRALLDGDKIPLIKSDTSWTSSLYGMTSMLTGQVKAKSSNEGIGYKSYLGMLLFTKSMKNMAYRSMDVQEATVRMTGAHESFRMDNAICELSADVSYKYHGIFLCFVNLLDGADNEYTIKNKAKYSYYGR